MNCLALDLEADHEEEDGEEDVAGHHVAEEAERERQRPREMADQLDRNHERRQRRNRPHEVLQVGDRALRADADVVVGEEDDQPSVQDHVGRPALAEIGGERRDEAGLI